MNTHHSPARSHAPSVTKVGTALLAALVVALLTIMATGGRTQAEPTNVITVGPAEVGFGAVQVDLDPNTAAERTLTVQNTGGEEVTLNLSLLDQLAGFSFRLPDGSNGNQITLKPFNEAGDKAEIQILFDPVLQANETEIFRETKLEFKSGLLGPTLATVDLSGTGTSYDPLTPDRPDLPPPGGNPNPGVQDGCTIIGTNGKDRLTGTAIEDTICGLGGNDRINGLGGNDTLKGDAGRDRVTDKSGTDKLFGGGGVDRLSARDGSPGDLLKGGPKKDKIVKDRRDRGSKR